VGVTRIDRRSGLPTDILLSRALVPAQAEKVYLHEIAHVIAKIAGELSTKGLSRDLHEIYDVLNRLGSAKPWGEATRPRDFGYPAAEWADELWAEAIRAYLANPNFLKTVSPGVGARIRAAVNANPRLKGIIQFNSMAAALAAAGGAASTPGEDEPE
jgi:hypothetical protein